MHPLHAGTRRIGESAPSSTGGSRAGNASRFCFREVGLETRSQPLRRLFRAIGLWESSPHPQQGEALVELGWPFRRFSPLWRSQESLLARRGLRRSSPFGNV